MLALTACRCVASIQHYNNYLEYSWEITQGTLNISDPGVLLSAVTSPNLVIAENMLVRGEEYTFRLNVLNNFSYHSGWNEVTVVISSPPTSGRFIVHPLTGVAGETNFLLKLENWEDDGLNPVQYELRYSDIDGEVPLVSRTSTNEFETVIPPVTRAEDGFALTLYAYIINKDESKAKVEQTIILHPPQLDHDINMAVCLEELSPLNIDGCGESDTRIKVLCENATAPYPGCPCNVDPLPLEFLQAAEFYAARAETIRKNVSTAVPCRSHASHASGSVPILAECGPQSFALLTGAVSPIPHYRMALMSLRHGWR